MICCQPGTHGALATLISFSSSRVRLTISSVDRLCISLSISSSMVTSSSVAILVCQRSFFDGAVDLHGDAQCCQSFDLTCRPDSAQRPPLLIGRSFFLVLSLPLRVRPLGDEGCIDEQRQGLHSRRRGRALSARVARPAEETVS